jgi:hypothetical protein
LSHGRFSPYEFALVVGIAFGWPILGSIASLLCARLAAQGLSLGHWQNRHPYADT